MAINYSTKINELLVPVSVASEPHIIGLIGVETYTTPFAQIRLIQVPQGPFPQLLFLDILKFQVVLPQVLNL